MAPTDIYEVGQIIDQLKNKVLDMIIYLQHL